MAIPQLLRRFDFVVLKNKSGTDNTQVPAAATFTFHRQGATVRTTTTLFPADPPPVLRDLPVDDIGLIEVGDWVSIGFGGPQFEVKSVIGRTKVQIEYTGISSLQVPLGTRLFAPTVQAYRDPNGSQPLTPPYATDSATGRYGAYIGAPRFDFSVSGSGFTTRTYIDYDGGPAVGALGWLLARDFTSIAAAIAACPDYQETTVVLEPTMYQFSQTLVIPATKRVRLLGGGRDLTVLKCTDKDLPTVWIKGSWSTLEQLSVFGPGQAGAGAGVVIGRLAADQPPQNIIMEHVRLRDVRIFGPPSWGLHILGTDAAGANNATLSLFGQFDAVTIDSPLSHGAIRIGAGNTTQRFVDSQCVRFVGQAILAKGSDGLTFQDVTCESWSVEGAPAFAEFEDCRSVTLLDCWFEEVPDPAPSSDRPWFIHVHGAGSDGFSVLGGIANRQPNAGTIPPPSYQSRAVKISGGVGATVAGLVTSTPNAPPSGQRRQDIKIEVPEDPERKPTLVVSGGVATQASSGSARDPLDVDFDATKGYAETSSSGTMRTFAALRPAVIPAFTQLQVNAIKVAETWPAGTLLFNTLSKRLECFDGAILWTVDATPS